MQNASSKQQTKQEYKPNHQQTGLPPSSNLPIRGKTNKQKMLSTISPYMKLTQTTGPNLGGQKSKGRKNSTLNPGKGDLKHKTLKKQTNKYREILTNEGIN